MITGAEDPGVGENSAEHDERCGCRDCDPDSYIDRAERDAGAGER